MARSSTTRKGNGAGKGDGWGGPAKGAAVNRAVFETGKKAADFAPGNQAAIGYHDMSDAERTKDLRQHLYTLAKQAEREETQLSATVAMLNRIEGMPVARNLNVNTDDITFIDDAALAERRAEVTRNLAEARSGAIETLTAHQL